MNRLAQINLTPTGEFTPLATLNLLNLISVAILIILIFAALAFLFMLILGGVSYITSGGDKGKTEAARGKITAALIGLVIVFAAWAVVNLVSTFFGVNILSFQFPTAQ
jgi:hypothetical protein